MNAGTGAFEALSARVEALSAVVEVLEARERARRIICGGRHRGARELVLAGRMRPGCRAWVARPPAVSAPGIWHLPCGVSGRAPHAEPEARPAPPACPGIPSRTDEASGGNLPGQEDRYRELAQRDALAKAIAIKKARGDYQPGGHVSEENFPPLTVAEHLEMIALGERIARYYAHPSQVDVAVKAGASWAQIAAARGTDEADRAAAVPGMGRGPAQVRGHG